MNRTREPRHGCSSHLAWDLGRTSRMGGADARLHCPPINNTRRVNSMIGKCSGNSFSATCKKWFSPYAVIILQREGTVEEIGAALKAAGADDGLILDNGGSVVCWVWWANLYAGGTVSTTVDYRPDGTSAIAFLLKGPLMTDLPGGSVSYTVL